MDLELGSNAINNQPRRRVYNAMITLGEHRMALHIFQSLDIFRTVLYPLATARLRFPALCTLPTLMQTEASAVIPGLFQLLDEKVYKGLVT